jgi:hypothetical protein
MFKLVFTSLIDGIRGSQFFMIDRFIKNPYKDTESSLISDWQIIGYDIKKTLKMKKNELQKK